MGWLILILVVMLGVAVGGGGYMLHQDGIKQGKAECKAEYEAADKKLAEKGAAAAIEYQDHINDMVVAYEAGAKEKEQKIVYIKSQGAKDVITYPVFSNPVCVLPADSLRNLNSARTGVGTPANPSVVANPVRETATSPVGNAPRDVHTDAGRRSPRGKVREQGDTVD